MPVILLDQNIPRGLRSALLAEHQIRTALQMGWDELRNGDLIAAAEAEGFDVLVTADQNIRYQQNLSGRRISVVVLGTNHWDEIRPDIERVRGILASVSTGQDVTITFQRSALRRRPYPRSGT